MSAIGPAQIVTLHRALKSPSKALRLGLVRDLEAEDGPGQAWHDRELILAGRVLPFGGIKEKTITARRAGLKALALPVANEKDFRVLPPPSSGRPCGSLRQGR